VSGNRLEENNWVAYGSERQQRNQNEEDPPNSSQTEPFSHLKKPVKDFT